MYMLDTNTCIYVLKNRDVRLKRKFTATSDLMISAVTYGELCFGIQNGIHTLRDERSQQLELFTRRLLVDPWNEEAGRHYGLIRADLKRQGRIIGSNDLLIAAHARSLNAVLVTNNTAEFSRVSELLIEDWTS